MRMPAGGGIACDSHDPGAISGRGLPGGYRAWLGGGLGFSGDQAHIRAPAMARAGRAAVCHLPADSSGAPAPSLARPALRPGHAAGQLHRAAGPGVGAGRAVRFRSRDSPRCAAGVARAVHRLVHHLQPIGQGGYPESRRLHAAQSHSAVAASTRLSLAHGR